MRRSFKVIQAKLQKELKESWCTDETYTKILSAIFESQHIPQRKRTPLQCSVDREEFADGVKRSMRTKKNSLLPSCLLIDFSSISAATTGYHYLCDDICNVLRVRIEEHVFSKNEYLDIIIIASDVKEFMNSVKLTERFVKTCDSKNVGLVILSVGNNPVTETLNRSSRLNTSPQTVSSTIIENINVTEIEKEITDSIELIHGHFEIHYGNNGNGHIHVPTILSLLYCSKKEAYLAYFQELIKNELQCDNYSIFFFGIQGNYMEGFVHALVNNENERWLQEHDIQKVANKKIAIVCDVLWNIYQLDEFINKLKRNGAKDIFLIGFGRYTSFVAPHHCKIKSFLDIPYLEHKASDGSCPACIQGSKAVKGEGVDDLLKKIFAFDDYTFWELMASTPDFFKSGHWPSPRTGKHYFHIIDVKKILSKYGYGITQRVLNLLSNTNNIKISWFNTILCPDEPEAICFAELIGKEIGINSSIEIVKIPREYFSKITGGNIPNELKEYLSEHYEENVLERRNILIVDQAAHHFVTLSALKYLSKYFNSTVLAFVVLIDRMYPLDLDKELPDSHYISLYRWPWPPFRGEMCPCTQAKEG